MGNMTSDFLNFAQTGSDEQNKDNNDAFGYLKLLVIDRSSLEQAIASAHKKQDDD